MPSTPQDRADMAALLCQLCADAGLTWTDYLSIRKDTGEECIVFVTTSSVATRFVLDWMDDMIRRGLFRVSSPMGMCIADPDSDPDQSWREGMKMPND